MIQRPASSVYWNPSGVIPAIFTYFWSDRTVNLQTINLFTYHKFSFHLQLDRSVHIVICSLYCYRSLFSCAIKSLQPLGPIHIVPLSSHTVVFTVVCSRYELWVTFFRYNNLCSTSIEFEKFIIIFRVLKWFGSFVHEIYIKFYNNPFSGTYCDRTMHAWKLTRALIF